MMRKYEKYKDSGVEWIGEIPEHWEIQRLKYNALIILGKMLMSNPPKGEEFKYTLEKYLKSKNIGWLQVFNGSKDVDEMWFNDLEKKLYKLEVGDIVMNEGGDIGKVSLWPNSDFDCYIQNSVHRITSPKNVDIKYLAYFLYATSKRGYFWSIVSQISIAHLTKEKLSNTPTVIPSLPEQESIASYLDSKVGEIDNMIEKTEKKIKLYEELKKSIITRAVTKGLNPNAKMKDSGVEWIGEVPEHWEAMKVTWIYQLIGSGTTPKTDKEYYYCENGEYWLQTGDLNDGIIRNTSKQITKECVKELNFKIYPKGSLVVAMYGATIGKVGLLNIETTTNQACCVMTTSKVLDNKYLFYWLQAFKNEIIQLSSGGGQPNINQEKVASLKISAPLVEDQVTIVNFLDHETAKIDSLISKQEKLIELLKVFLFLPRQTPCIPSFCINRLI